MPVFKKNLPFTVDCKNTTIFVKTGPDSTPRSVINGSVYLFPESNLDTPKFEVSLIQRIKLKTVNAMQTVHAHVSENKFASQILVPLDSKKCKKTTHKLRNNSNFCTGKYNFDLWVPDNLEPSVLSASFDIVYYIKICLKYKIKNKWFSYYKNISHNIPLTFHTLPGFLKIEQLDINLDLPFNNCLYKDKNIAVFLQLPSKYFTNNHTQNKAATLIIHNYFTDQDMLFDCKSLTLELVQELFFSSHTHNGYKQNILLFKKKYLLEGCSKDTIVTEARSLPGLNNPGYKHIREYTGIDLPYINKDCHTTVSMYNLTASHYIKANAYLEAKGTKTCKIISAKLDVFFITAYAQSFLYSLPVYSKISRRSLVY
ncbi:hypothetical protein BB561_006065 [Smittium simulii]|uniref:Arrestin-like N-terminal domain-containing protein n=1 Tax=Smittium simulii TaxID=133385 RepID=A0A2T9Y6V9_9FUNG|nr:hypothetical protein BB561_006065 [Smittium simulii]